MSTLEVNTINPQSGNDVTLGGSSKNVKFASGTTVDFNTNTPTLTLGADMKNTPMVSAYMSASQTPSNNTHTKIQYNTEVYDTDSAYDHSSNYRFTVPSGKAGKYLINATCYMFGNNNDEKFLEVSIYKNGSQVQRDERHGNYSTGQNSGGVQSITRIMDLSASDYIEIYGRINVNSGTPSFYGASAADQRYSVLNIAKMIG
jgi:viroplasmin and RNaseH domain-containing protein